MAITNVNITQDNIEGASNLMAIHSPLIFLADVTWQTTAPDILYCEIHKQISNVWVLQSTYKCIPFADISANVRQFAFIANEPILGIMPEFDDFAQLDNSLIYVDNIMLSGYSGDDFIRLKFVGSTNVENYDTVVFTPVHAVRQLGESPNLLDIYQNTIDTYYAAKDDYVYVYFHCIYGGETVSVGSSSITPCRPGYYRYKTKADLAKTIDFYWTDASPILVASKNIIPIDVCEGYRTLKYLDKNGQYRFFPFNSFYQTYDNPSLIGTVNKFITSILTDQSTKSVVGYKNDRKIDLTADVDELQLEKLSEIYTSPRVYLYIGTTEDTAKDWLEVTVQPSQAIVRRRKGSYGRIDLTVTLPEHFTIRMI